MTKKTDKDQKRNKTNGDDLWKSYTKDITPLDNRNVDFTQEKQPTKESSAPSKPYRAPPIIPAQAGAKSKETDASTLRRLKRGQITIEARLDLHGMTQQQAYDALRRFIPHAHNSGKRCVLVITGKGGWQDGSASLLEKTTGILKQKTPEWLREPPLDQYVLNIQTARPQDGGEGALYVLLRRNRDI